MMARIWRR